METKPFSQKTPIFIIGAPRSGTTFLTRLLNKFLDIHIARDGGTILRYKKLLPNYGDLSQPSNMQRLINNLFEDYFFNQRILQRGFNVPKEDVIANFKGNSFAELMDYLLTKLAKAKGKTRWGNKRPSYSLQVNELSELFPSARFLHIIRDGRDVALSMRKATASPMERNWYYSAKLWELHIMQARIQGQQLPAGRYKEIKYEDLMKEPVSLFQEIVRFMGEPDENLERLKKFDKEIREMIKPNNYDKWKRDLPEKAIRIVEQAVGPTLRELQYPIMFPELINKQFNLIQRAEFYVDNIWSKTFSPSFSRSLTFKFQEVKARLKSLV